MSRLTYTPLKLASNRRPMMYKLSICGHWVVPEHVEGPVEMTMHTTLWWFRGPQPPRLRPRQPQTECFSTMPRSFAPILIMGLQVGIQANFCSFSSPFESLRDRPSTGSGTALRLALGPFKHSLFSRKSLHNQQDSFRWRGLAELLFLQWSLQNRR